MNIIKRLTTLAGVALLAFGAQAFAATAPGTVISNTATVDYEVAGIPDTENSNTVNLTVDELVDVEVTRQGAASVNVNSPTTDQAVRFTVTNLGNGSEEFDLVAANQGADDYDVNGILVYLDDGDGVFEPGADDGAPITDHVFAAGDLEDFWVSVDIPASQPDGDDADVALTATSSHGTGTPGDASDGTYDGAGDGDGGVELVWGASGGDDVDGVEFNILNLTFTFTKASVVTDPFGGSTVVPGSTIHYTITISATGAATATSVVITDPIPADTTFVAASIEFDTVANSDAADADECDHNVTNPGEITCTLPDMTGGDSHTIEFEVTID